GQCRVPDHARTSAGFKLVDQDLDEGKQLSGRAPLLYVHQPAPRHETDAARSAARPPPEGARVRELPSEVEAAGELEQCPDRCSFLLELRGERESGARIEEQSHPFATGARR